MSFDEQLNRIESKLDDALTLVANHETLINHPEIGLVRETAKNGDRLTSLEGSRIRIVAWVAGLGMSGGTLGAWIAKALKLGEGMGHQ